MVTLLTNQGVDSGNQRLQRSRLLCLRGFLVANNVFHLFIDGFNEAVRHAFNGSFGIRTEHHRSQWLFDDLTTFGGNITFIGTQSASDYLQSVQHGGIRTETFQRLSNGAFIKVKVTHALIVVELSQLLTIFIGLALREEPTLVQSFKTLRAKHQQR